MLQRDRRLAVADGASVKKLKYSIAASGKKIVTASHR